MINGSPGHLRTVNGKLCCVADTSPDTASDGVAQRNAAYANYDNELANAWRKP
jgi:hypothetical protein